MALIKHSKSKDEDNTCQCCFPNTVLMHKKYTVYSYLINLTGTSVQQFNTTPLHTILTVWESQFLTFVDMLVSIILTDVPVWQCQFNL